METRTVRYTWMAFSIAALVMLGLQSQIASPVFDRSALVSTLSFASDAVEGDHSHGTRSASLPVVTRLVNQPGSQAQPRQTWTF